MTRDQVAEMGGLAVDVQRWLERGALQDPPFAAIRRLAMLAAMAAVVIETWREVRRRDEGE